MTSPEQQTSITPESEEMEAPPERPDRSFSSTDSSGRDQDIQQLLIRSTFSKRLGHVVLTSPEDKAALESKGFGVKGKTDDDYYLKDYEVLYLMYTGKLSLSMPRGKAGKSRNKRRTQDEPISFTEYVDFSLSRDENAWTRFLIFRDLRSRGYVVREGFGFPIDFRVYERGDYGNKAAKYIVFGLNEGKTMSVHELKKNVDEMSTMGKEAVVAVVERRGEVVYYKVGKWRPIKPQ